MAYMLIHITEFVSCETQSATLLYTLSTGDFIYINSFLSYPEVSIPDLL